MTEFINFDFEGAGAPAGIVVTGTGSIDFDSATAPAPLAGTLSMNMQPGSASTALVATAALGTNASTVYTYQLYNAATVPAGSNSTIIIMADTLAGEAATVTLSGSTNRFSMTSGSASVNGPADLVSATTYHMWFEHTKSGVGLGDAVTRLYYSTDGVKPVSPQLELLTGDNENDVIEYLMTGRNRGYLPEYRDSVKAGDVAYGDNGTLPSTEAPGWIGPEGLKTSGGLLLANTVMQIVTRPTAGSAATIEDSITLDALGVPTINDSNIGSVGGTTDINIRLDDSADITYRNQTIIDLNA